MLLAYILLLGDKLQDTDLSVEVNNFDSGKLGSNILVSNQKLPYSNLF